MRTDAFLLLSDAQAVTADAVSTNALKIGAAGLDIGIGEPLAVVFVIDVAADYTTATRPTSSSSVPPPPTTAPPGLPRSSRPRQLLARPLPLAPASRSCFAGPCCGDGDAPRGFLRRDGDHPTVTVTAFVQPASMVQNDVYYASGFSVQA